MGKGPACWPRRRTTRRLLVSLAAAVLLLGLLTGSLPCTVSPCRIVGLYTHPITVYPEYRDLLRGSDVARQHEARWLRIDCQAIRQDVARRLRAGELLTARSGQISAAQQLLVQRGVLDAWITGATLHVKNALADTPADEEAWRANVERLLAKQPEDRQALAGLFRALVLHGASRPAVVNLGDAAGCGSGQAGTRSADGAGSG